jgi:8-oxo-dGTP pyrophosphatase MutT (NUDIX family)
MDLYFNTEDSYTKFKAELKERLSKRNKLKKVNPDFMPSAVFILLMNKDNEVHVFLTKRTDKVRTHKGQVSFPGGAREESDKTMLETALRETYEETGIRSEDIEFLGEFDEYLSISSYHVSTFVGSVKYPYVFDININTHEIAEYFEAPISLFYDKKYDRVEQYREGNKELEVYYYSYKQFTIWGLTAKMLTEFASEIIAG